MAFPEYMTQSSILYFSDCLTLLLFLAGVSWVLDHVLARSFRRIFVNLTFREALTLVALQLGVVLVALVGFKFIVLSGGPGVLTRSILRHGPLTRGLSITASLVAFVLVCIGAWRWTMLIKKFVVLRIFK